MYCRPTVLVVMHLVLYSEAVYYYRSSGIRYPLDSARYAVPACCTQVLYCALCTVLYPEGTCTCGCAVPNKLMAAVVVSAASCPTGADWYSSGAHAGRWQKRPPENLPHNSTAPIVHPHPLHTRRGAMRNLQVALHARHVLTPGLHRAAVQNSGHGSGRDHVYTVGDDGLLSVYDPHLGKVGAARHPDLPSSPARRDSPPHPFPLPPPVVSAAPRLPPRCCWLWTWA